MRSPRAFWIASAVVFALLAGVGFFAVAKHRPIVGASDVLVFDTPQNVLHAVLALASAGFALSPWRVAIPAARVAAVALLALAALGFVSGRLFGLSDVTGFHLELVENTTHLALGAWATWVGYQKE